MMSAKREIRERPPRISLIEEVEASGDAAEQLRKRALDPALAPADVAGARRQMEDAAFRRDRLQTAVAKLRERLEEVKAQEEDQRRWVAYEKVKAERDKLTAELTDIYPAFEQKLADLLPRIEANDWQIERINTRLPDGAKHLHVAELVARGLGTFVDGTATVPRITRQLRLPAFKYSALNPYAWPRRQ
jgi:chromosome segregation ATPase